MFNSWWTKRPSPQPQPHPPPPLRQPKRTMRCSACSRNILVEQVHFWCDDKGSCPRLGVVYDGKPKDLEKESLFCPGEEFPDILPCPGCGEPAFIKVCPCGARFPPPVDGPRRVALVGTISSGKTCFVTGLVRQIRRELAKQDRFAISHNFDHDEGRKHFGALYKRIFEENELPDTTQSSQRQIMRFTLGIPDRNGADGEPHFVSMVFPDVSGENQHEAALLKQLRLLYYQVHATILLIDPVLGPTYQEWSKANNRPLPQHAKFVRDYDDVLDVLIQLRRDCGQGKGPLAVVLAKCDEPGVYDPDKVWDPLLKGTIPTQGGRQYNPTLANLIGKQVRQFLHDSRVGKGLGMEVLITKAEHYFAPVQYFAASALGKPTVKEADVKGRTIEKIYDASPRRVEEPLLWILHHWGLL